ncbi:MAG: hypothetical protein ACPLRH_07935, partial [Desulfotomaculales bacterium]
MISVDLGYGYTKGVSGQRKIIFPSVVAPAQDSTANFGRTIGHVVEIRRPGEMKKEKYYVGEAAVKEGRAAQVSLDREKFAQEISAVIALTAAYLLGAEKQSSLVTGLPLAYYSKQKDHVENFFKGIVGYVSVDGGPERPVSFSRVYVYPQGVGAVYAQEKIPEEGLVGLLDIGFFTTEHVLFECTPEEVVPLRSYCSSVEGGVSMALKLFADSFRQATGMPISLPEAQNVWKKERVTFRGREIEIKPLKEKAVREAGKAIMEAVNAAWSEKACWLDEVILVGGGSVEFY